MVLTPTEDNFPAYKDRFLKTYFQEPIPDDTDNCDSPIVFPDNDTPITITTKMSQIEYQKLLDCILQGAIIIYPNEVNKIWWSFTRMVDCPMDLCQLIADCINDPTSPAYDAVTNISLSNAESALRDYSQSLNNVGLQGNTNDQCNRDILWAQSLQFVEYFHSLNVEAFAQMEVATNDFELIANVIGDITFVDESSADSVLAYIEWAIDNLKENYDAQATLAYREGLACDIFCLAYENNCNLSPDICFTVLRDRVSATVTIESLITDTIQYMVSGSWAGKQIADIMFFSQFAIRSQLGKWLGLNAYIDVPQRLQLAVNDANNDWITLCDECPTNWFSYFDFRVDPYSDYISDNDSTGVYPFIYTSGQGWQGGNGGGTRGSVDIIFDDVQQIDTVEAIFNGGGAGNQRSSGIRLYDAFDVLIASDEQDNITSNTDHVFTLSDGYSDVKKIEFLTGCGGCLMYLQQTTITGNGVTNPIPD